MAKNRQVLIKFEGDSRGLVSASKLTNKELSEIQKTAKTASTELRGLSISKADVAKAALALTAGLAAGAAAIVANTRAGLQQVDSQAKLARSLDTTFDSVTALNMAFGDGGIDGGERSLARLNRRLGAAALGRGSALKAVQELNLDLKTLNDLPADEKLAVIADRISDVAGSAQEAARFAQDLGFEQAAAAQFFLQGGDAIRGYAEQVDKLGLSVSDFDATQVERANDAMGILGDLTQSVQQQLAVEAAPYLEAIFSRIEENIIEMGGLGDATELTFNKMIDGAAIVLDAFNGVGRVFDITANLMVTTLAGALDVLAGNAATAVEILNKIPTVRLLFDQEDINQLREYQALQKDVARQGLDAINEALTKPLAGESLRQLRDELAAEQAALESEFNKDKPKNEPNSGGGGGLSEDDIEALAKGATAYRELTASLSDQRTMLLMNERELFIYEAQMRLTAGATDDIRQNAAKLAGTLFDERKALDESASAAKRAKEILSGLRTEQDLLQDSIREVNLLIDMGELTDSEGSSAIKKLIDDFEELNKKTGESEDQFRELRDAVNGWGRDFANSVVDADFTFAGFADNILKQLAKIALQQATQPLFSGFGNIISSGLGSLFSGFGVTPANVAQNGAAFSADGNLFTRPSLTTIAERGQAEAVLPLARVGGQLGVQVAGGGSGGGESIQISVAVDAKGTSVSGNDAKSNQLGKAFGNAIRDVMIQEKRPGGLLAK